MLPKLKSHWPCLLLILAVLSLFWPALLHPFYVLFPTFSPFSDVMVIHWPKAHLMAQSWQAGEGLPYWTPLILSGMPLGANQLAMLFYPPAWLFLFFPVEPIFNLLFIFHLVLGGIGVYLLLYKNHQVSALAALLGGLTFALNGKGLAHVVGGHVSMVGAIAWLPWTVFGVQMLLEERGEEATRSGRGGEERRGGEATRSGRGLSPFGLGWMALVTVSLVMQTFTHTLPVIYSVYLMAAMVIWHTASQRINESAHQLASTLYRNNLNVPYHVSRFTFYVLRFICSFISALVPLLVSLILTGLLGAVQLLPLLELAQFSNRSLSLSQATEFTLSPAQLLLGLLLPTAQSGHEYVIYVGLVPLLLAPLGLTRQNRWTWFYGLLFLFALLFALGPQNPLHNLFYYFMPGFRWVRTPARIFFVGALAIAILVGFGADQLIHRPWSPAAKKWLTRLTTAIAPLALLVGLGLAFGFTSTSSYQGEVKRAALALATFIPAGLILVWLRVQQMMSAQLTVGLLGLLLFLDLAWFDQSMLRFVPLDEALASGRAAAEYLAQKPGYFRVYSPSYSLPMQTAAAAGLRLADGVEPVHLAVYDQYMARAGGYHDASFSVTIPPFSGPLETSLEEVEPNLKLLGLLNVTYLASAFPMSWPGLSLETEIDGTFIYRNERAVPRAWVAHQAVPSEADWLAQLEAMSDMANVIIVENDFQDGDQSAISSQQSTTRGQGSIARITHYSANRIEVETEISQPGWLVLSEIWYPGWQATVNDSPQPVEKVNGLLRGVYLAQPGSYQITLAYYPRSVQWGGWITGITTALLILGGSLILWRSKK